jgi:hypothetical protein
LQSYDGGVASAVPEARTVLAELEESNRLLVQQVFKPIANEHRISVAAPGSTEEGRPLLYVTHSCDSTIAFIRSK